MTGAGDLLQPTRLRLILAATLIIPVLFFLVIISEITEGDLLVFAVLALVISYIAACGIDHLIENRTVKIAIASVAALVSLVLGYLVIRSMTMVYDPVHPPGIVCDPVHEPGTTPTVIATVQPTATTPMIYDPVHNPAGSGAGIAVVTGTTTGTVAQKLDECRKKCGQ
jgi:ribose/xylose/arabinose/galactoside ABC-type transport system permease subunit